MGDHYSSFSDLAEAEEEDADFRVIAITRGDTLVAAPHGGGIEPGTSELAQGIADPDHSLYLFEGCKPKRNRRLHITSHRFTEPRCLELAATANLCIAVHGCRDRPGSLSDVYVGGANTSMKRALVDALIQGGFAAEVDTVLPGTHPRNVCNLPKQGGAQLEISEKLRTTMFRSLDRSGRTRPTPTFWAFCEAVRTVL
jgi:phage replication-related protein YjqB (UPF0714/DUF867 family)